MSGPGGPLCAITNPPSPAAAAVAKKPRREGLVIVSTLAFSFMAYSHSQKCAMIIAKGTGRVKGGAIVARQEKSVADNALPSCRKQLRRACQIWEPGLRLRP